MRRYIGRSGFSLYEVLVALAVIALVAVMAIPQVERASFRSKLAMEKANIALIQEAKEAYAADNPGRDLANASDLLAYLPDQQLPKSPFGTEYKNLTDLSRPVISGSSDVPITKDNNFVAIAKSEASGYNSIDGSGSSTPIVVLNVPTPTPTIVTPTPEIVTPTPKINNNPSVMLSAAESAFRNQSVSLLASGSDIDDDPLIYTFSAGGTTFAPQSANSLNVRFPSLGVKPLSVLVEDGQGGSDTASRSVNIINQLPSVSLDSSLTNTYRNNPIRFTAIGSDPDNDPITYQFKINDDAPLGAGAGSILDQAFASLGKQKVSVVVNDGFGGIASAEKEVMITNRPPTASLARSASSVYPNSNVTFTTTASDPDSDALSYTYTVDGQTLAKSTNPSVSRSFSTLGTKNVSVLVEDGFGGSVSRSTSVDVVEVPNSLPSVTIAASPTSGARGQSFSFTATGTDPDGDALTYSFNNGAYSSSKTFSAAYNTLGNQSVSVRARDSKGAESAPATAIVSVVNRVPSVTLTPNPASGVRGQSFTFTASGNDPDGDPLTYSFNNAAYGSSKTFTTTYASLGTQWVSVKAKDNNGGESSLVWASVSVVNRNPSVSLSVNPASIQEGQSATFTAAGSDPDGDSLTYSFRVGSTGAWTAYSSSASYTQSFATAGTYTVFVKASDAFGAESNIAQANLTVVVPNVNLNVLVNPTSYGAGQGSGSYPKGATATASASAHYGYRFVNWADNRGTANPLSVALPSSTTVTANMDRQTFKVTLKLFANINSTDGRLWARARAQILDSAGKVIKDTMVTDYGSANAAAGKSGTLEVWVPYGDTITVSPWGSTYSVHLSTSWNDASGTRLQHIRTKDYTSYVSLASHLTDRQYTVTGDLNLGEIRVGTPILIDLSGDGKPDLLAGVSWARTKDRRPSPSKDHFRLFDIDGTGEKPWEWVGPKDGLLVYLLGLEGTPSARNLFGTKTFGKDWKHGYEPLATLDKDKDGSIAGNELTDIGVWVDANSDAVAQAGEIKTAKEIGLTEVSVRFEEDDLGNVQNKKGATINGKEVNVWDWISYGYPELTKSSEVAQLDWTNQIPPEEFFSVDTEDSGLEKIDMLPKGTLRVYKINDQLYVRSTAFLDEKGERVMDVLFPAQATEGGVLSWGAGGLSNSLVASGTDYYGLTTEGKGYGVWSAKLVSGDLAGLF